MRSAWRYLPATIVAILPMVVLRRLATSEVSVRILPLDGYGATLSSGGYMDGREKAGKKQEHVLHGS